MVAIVGVLFMVVVVLMLIRFVAVPGLVPLALLVLLEGLPVPTLLLLLLLLASVRDSSP